MNVFSGPDVHPIIREAVGRPNFSVGSLLVDKSSVNKALFMTTIYHETGGFSRLTESLAYTPTRLKEIFPSRTRKLNVSRLDEICSSPEKVGNFLYGGRMGNSLTEGFLYRGRGLFQFTGKDMYRAIEGAFPGIDAINTPDIILRPSAIFPIAAWYWNERVRGKISNPDHLCVTSVTKIVNGGLTDLEKREKLFSYFLNDVGDLA